MEIYQAVNKMLRYIGEMPIPDGVSIDDLETSHEAYTAREILLDKSKELQSAGWWFNKMSTTLVPDYRGDIVVSENIVSVNASDSGYIINENKLYDPTNNTYLFTDPVTVTVIYENDFDDLPLTFANWVVYTAASEFQLILNGDDVLEKKLTALASTAYVNMLSEDMRNKSYNLISGSRIVSRDSNPEGVS